MKRTKSIQAVKEADGNKEVKLSFRLTQAEAERLAERTRPGESSSKAAARILSEALTQTSLEEALRSLPALAAAAKALIDDVPGKLAAEVLDRVATQSAGLISQKISDIAAAQASREDQQRLLAGKVLDGIGRIEAAQVKTAAAVVGIKNQFA